MRDEPETEEKLADILRKLPLKPGAERHISAAAHLLVFHARLPRGRLTRGDKAAISELTKLTKHLRDALSVLDHLSAEASLELSEKLLDVNETLLGPLRLRDLASLMSGLAGRAVIAKERLEAKSAKRPGRRPKDIATWFTTIALLGFYEEFTGEHASVTVDATRYQDTRIGDFVDLVTDVFRVLDLGASPSSQAAAAVKRDSSRFGVDFAELVAVLTGRKSRKGLSNSGP